MGMIFKLKPQERIVINGSVISNPGLKNIDIKVETQSVILRERDFMREEEATTPCRRLYYLGVLAILDEEKQEKHKRDFVEWLGEIMSALRNPVAIAAGAEVAQEISEGNFYRVLKGCRALIDYEDIALGRNTTGDEAVVEPVA